MKKIKAKTSQIAKGLEWQLSWRRPETLQTDQNVSTTLTVYHGPRGALPDLLGDHNRSLLNLQTGICCTIWHQCTTRSSHLYVLWDNFKIDSHQTYSSNLRKLSKAVTIRTEVITFQFWKSCITYNQSKTMTATKCKKRERNSDSFLNHTILTVQYHSVLAKLFIQHLSYLSDLSVSSASVCRSRVSPPSDWLMGCVAVANLECRLISSIISCLSNTSSSSKSSPSVLACKLNGL